VKSEKGIAGWKYGVTSFYFFTFAYTKQLNSIL